MNNKRASVKQLLREVFWQLSDLDDKQIDRSLVRTTLTKYVQKEILEAYLLGLGGNDFWDRVEQIIYTHLEAVR